MAVCFGVVSYGSTGVAKFELVGEVVRNDVAGSIVFTLIRSLC